MGLFDIFKKTPTVRCVQCGVQMKETEAHRYRNGVYCSICFSHQDFTTGAKSNITIDIPNLTLKKDTAAQNTGNQNTPAIIKDIKSNFDTSGIKSMFAQFDDQWEVHAGVNGQGVTYTMKFICKASDNNVFGLRIFELIHVPAAKRRDVLLLLSQLQARYRFWRFNLDSSNSVNIEYDFPPATSNHGKMAVELFIRTVKMIDDIYAELYQCVWK